MNRCGESINYQSPLDWFYRLFNNNQYPKAWNHIGNSLIKKQKRVGNRRGWIDNLVSEMRRDVVCWSLGPQWRSVHSWNGSFGSEVGKIGHKWDKSRGFSDQISVHLAPPRQMHWNLIWKSHGFVPFGANLTRLWRQTYHPWTLHFERREDTRQQGHHPGTRNTILIKQLQASGEDIVIFGSGLSLSQPPPPARGHYSGYIHRMSIHHHPWGLERL